MALALDASTPAAVNVAINATAPVTASFTPPSGALLVAFVSMDGPQTGTPQTMSSVTGGSLTWTLWKRSNAQHNPNLGGTAEVWWATIPSSASMTVTAHPAVTTHAGGLLYVGVFTGAATSITGAASTNASSGTGGLAATITASLTTGLANSWVWGVLNNFQNSTAPTVPSGQTNQAHNLNATNGNYWWVQKQNATTTSSGTSVTINDTAPSVRWQLVVVEIPAATGAGSVTGVTSLLGGGTFTASGVPTVSGTPTLSGGGTLTASGTPTVKGIPTLSGGGTFATTGTRKVSGISPLAGGATFTATGAPTVLGHVALLGGGTFTSTGVPTVRSALSLLGGGTFTASGTPTVKGITALSAGGTFTATGIRKVLALTALSGGGLLLVTGTGLAPNAGHLTFLGGGTLTATGTRKVFGVPGLSGGGTFHVTGTRSGLDTGVVTLLAGGLLVIVGTITPLIATTANAVIGLEDASSTANENAFTLVSVETGLLIARESFLVITQEAD